MHETSNNSCLCRPSSRKKILLQQQEKLTIAQRNVDTAIVLANWLMQMSDYTYIHQSESIIKSMKAQLSDKELPMLHSPASTHASLW